MEITNVFEMDRSDLPEVAGLAAQLGYPTRLDQLHARYEILEKRPDHGLFVFKTHQVLGWIHLQIMDDLIEESAVEIRTLVVDENSRSLGVGKSLIEFARKWSKIRNHDMLFLTCNIVRTRAHAFYEREGFTLNKTSHFYEQRI